MGTLAGHILGYVQEWKNGTYTAAEKKEFAHYFGDSTGVTGVEKTYNDILTGRHGKRSLYKDEKGSIVGRAAFDTRAPSQGAELTLTIDAGMQCLVENVLRKAGRAAAVVMDVNTGEVLAMASVPNVDPNFWVPSLSQADADYLYKNEARPLLNRAVESYQCASTAKVAVALTALMNGETNFGTNCHGFVNYGVRTRIHCHNKHGHGPIKLENALKRSCNPYFMNLANKMGRQDVVDGFTTLNFGRRTGVGLPNEKPGTLPGSQVWFQKNDPGTIVTASELAMMSIGQWQMQASPLQICALTACVANGGKYYQPRLLKTAMLQGESFISDSPKLEVDLIADKGVSPADLKRVQKGMWMAANDGGTATLVTSENFRAAAKTGTVQVGPKNKRTNNAWVTAFAPYDKPRYAVTVFVEGGASGGKVAGPLAHIILRGIHLSEKNLKLPIRKMGKYAGHFDRIEEIELPKDSLLTIDLGEAGETGAEVSEVLDDNEPIVVKPNTIPLPGGGGTANEGD